MDYVRMKQTQTSAYGGAMKKLGLALLAVALSTPFTFAQAPRNRDSQPTTQDKTAKRKVKHQKQHKTKTGQTQSAQPVAK
jgi:hypothetical protein